MDVYSFALANKEIFKILYALIVVIISIVIVLRTDKLFRLSFHNGIRYFRNAFFFYGIGFAIRFIIGSSFIAGKYFPKYLFLVNIIFEFFLVMAGFFLLYSLLWKKFERGVGSPSSLLNPKLLLFYFMTLIIVILDYAWEINYLMFFSQILLFLLASIISFINLNRANGQHKFLKFYFAAMILSLAAWTLNAMAALYFNWNQFVLTNIYVLNLIVFLLFLYGVVKVTKIK